MANPPQPRLVLWRRDLAQTLGIGMRTLDKLRSNGTIPSPDVQLGGRMGWRSRTIEAWLEERGSNGPCRERLT